MVYREVVAARQKGYVGDSFTMSVLEGFETYYGLFGIRGVLLAGRSRLLKTSDEIEVVSSGIRQPVHLRLRTSDVSVFRQVLITREYELPFRASPRIIIDAGANIGLTSIYFANRYPRAAIIALEPELSNFQILKKNTAPYENIMAVRAGLWKDNGQICLIDPNSGKYGFRTVEIDRSGSGQRGAEVVSATTVESILKDAGIDHVDILKLDIEGSEKEVFDNSSAWIDRVDIIIVEFHDQFRVGCARSVYLAAKDFDLEWRRGETVFLARKNADATRLSAIAT